MDHSSKNPAQEQFVDGFGGLRINIHSWRPAGAPKAVVAIVPGFNSHGGYYGWVADQLAAAGYAVHAVDLRGRGKSDGERFYVEKFSDYTSDVDGMMKLARARDPGLPIVLFGHSAGGVVSCIYTLDHQADLAGLICEDFAFQVPAPDFALAVIKGIGHLAPHAHVLKLNNENFSRDPDTVRFMNEDPLIAHEVQPSRTIGEMVVADERLKRDFPLVTLPVLILHGTEDKVTKPAGSQLFYDKATSKDKTLKLYEGSYHDPLNDVDRETVMADFLTWIGSRVK